MIALISHELKSSAETIASIDNNIIDRISDVLVKTIKDGNKIIFMVRNE